MNLSLFDPFRISDIPETVEDYLIDTINSKANCCQFNRRGTLLAVGCQGGQISVWDFETKSIIRLLISHNQCVNSLCWSRSGKNILSCSNDGSLVYWNLNDSRVEKKLDLETQILFCQIHPREPRYCIISCNATGLPMLVDLEASTLSAQPILTSTEGTDLNSHSMMIVSFNRKGTKIFIGDGHGTVCVIDWKTRKSEHCFKVSSSGIKSFEFSRNCKMILVNSSDKALRLYQLPDVNTDNTVPTFMREFTDSVNRVQWKKAGFSNNNEYIYGGMVHKSIQTIMIWNATGGLVKGLEGPKEGLLDVIWHPIRPVIISVSYSGVIYIWASYISENWSSFAPDFQELDENEEYQEKEDEFDVKDEDDQINSNSKPQNNLKTNNSSNNNHNLNNSNHMVIDDEQIDILECDKMDEWSSDEDEDIYLLSFIPNST